MNVTHSILKGFAVLAITFFSVSLLAADTGKWTVTGNMNVGRLGHTATLLPNNKVLVVGGETSNKVTASAELYDPNLEKWILTGSMAKPRAGHSATLLPSGKILVTGGVTGDIVSGNQSSSELYDPKAGKWTATGSMQEPRCGHIATLISTGPLAGKVLVIGGGYCGGYGTDTAELYDPNTETWSYTGSLLVARYWGPEDRAIVFTDGSVLINGGTTYKPNSGYIWPNEAELFEPVTQTWSATNKTTDANGPMVLLKNGLVLVAGGNKTPNAVASAELYNHAINRWAVTSSMAYTRWDPSLTRLTDGKVLVVGGEGIGWGPCSGLSSAEMYDPSAGQWSSAGLMANARSYHSATLLRNGKVLVAGGRSSDCSSIFSSAELYTPAIMPAPPQILSLGDTNHDTTPELAVITHDATRLKTVATIKDAKTGALVKTITFNGRYAPVKANVVNDLNGNGAPEIAVLGVNNSNQSVQVEVRDSLTGVKLSAVPFTSNGQALDIALIRNFSGAGSAALAVLQQTDTGAVVLLANAKTGQFIRSIAFSNGYNGIDLIVINDLNGNKTKELAVLLDNTKPNSSDSVEIRDSSDGQLLHSIAYGSGSAPKQLFSIADVNNNGFQELAILRINASHIVVKDAQTSLAINTLNYNLKQPYKLVSVADDVSAITDIAMLGQLASGQIRADVRSVLTDSLIGKIVFDTYGTTVGFISIPDINGNGVAELVRLREQSGPQKLFAEVRDGRTGKWLQGMYF